MFIHLHNHSHYSLLDGLPKIDDYIKKALEYKMPALGLTDHGSMYGIIEFYQKCKEAGIKPIIGCEMYLAPRELHLKHHQVDDKLFHIVLLAKNEKGYKNLMHLTTVAYLDGFYYKPRIDKKVLREHADGLIATSACAGGEIPVALKQNRFDKAIELVKEYQDIFGKENFYLELEYIGNIKDQIELNNELIKLAKKTKTPLVGGRDTHYINEDDKVAQDVLVCVQTGKVLTDEKRLNMTSVDLSFLHPKLMEEYFKEIAPEAIKNTEKIAAECNLKLDLGQWYFPKFELPEGITAEQHLEELSEQGLKNKIPQADDEVKKRLNYELEIINKKGYAPYFLIVSDIVKWARSKEITTTTRGSCAGSLVGYLADITTLNPLDYDLPFERFLNPYRPSPPDIDMDFADNRREEVIEYTKQKYGHDRVANIVTFGTMMARAAVRDVTRVLDLPYILGDKIAKLIPFGAQGFAMTIDRALQENSELKQLYDSDPQVKQVIDLSKKVEGCVRHVSVHAAGVVIAPSTLTDFTPLQKDTRAQQNIITQYEMHSCEAVGLLKMDLLGIRNLSILGDAVKIVEKTKNIKIDLDNIPLDDKKTFKFVGQGHTFGMFQLGGSGMTKWMKQLKPTNIKDIMAMIALFRPGPMESIPEYIGRKHGQRTVEYLDPKLELILKDSYGVITYQDDVLLIAIEVAGYNWETVDKFRKAIGKKIPELMAQQEKDFVKGCQEHSDWSLEKSERLWKLFDPFKGYGFNKAHAASYSLVAYQTAYLKSHYPAEFMTAVMTAEAQNTDKIVEAVQECDKLGIKVLPPDVNYSRPDFTYISDKEIRFGLLAIKNLGTDIANVIIANRKDKGLFNSLENFLVRIETKNLNKKSLEALVKSGAMDSLGERNQMLENMDRLLAFIKYRQKEKNSRQSSLFGSLADGDSSNHLRLSEARVADNKTKLAWEKELLGLYVSGHPFAEMNDLVAQHITCQCINLTEFEGNRVKVAGIVSKIQRIFTRKNELMMFVSLSDTSAEVEVLVFPNVLKNNSEVWQEDKHVFVTGKVSTKDDKPKILVDKAYQIDKDNFNQVMQEVEKDLQTQKQKFNNKYNNNYYNKPKVESVPVSDTKISKIWITLPNFFNSDIHNQLKDIFNQFKGDYPIYLTITQSGIVRKIETDFKVRYNSEIKQALEKIVGSGNITIEYK